MKRLQAAASMVEDGQWEPADDAGNLVALIVQYASGRFQLLPNYLPTIGHLDDAIAVEAAWPSIQAEVADFLERRRGLRLRAQRHCRRRPRRTIKARTRKPKKSKTFCRFTIII